MSPKTVGILSPGDMGHIVGQVLGSHGLRVITCLQGRSERTRSLASRANVVDVPTYQSLVSEADMILSILVPAQAEEAARLVAQAMSETRADLTYVDCNAVSPESARAVGTVVEAAGASYVDAGIIGPPPIKGASVRLYLCGERAAEVAALFEGCIMQAIALEGRVGTASALKVCYVK